MPSIRHYSHQNEAVCALSIVCWASQVAGNISRELDTPVLFSCAAFQQHLEPICRSVCDGCVFVWETRQLTRERSGPYRLGKLFWRRAGICHPAV